jgi:hypothetical protein
MAHRKKPINKGFSRADARIEIPRVGWRIARMTNSKAITNEAGSSVLKRFDGLAEIFNCCNERIAETSDEYVKALEALKGNIDQITEAPRRRLRKLSISGDIAKNVAMDDLGMLPIVGRIARRLSQRDLACRDIGLMSWLRLPIILASSNLLAGLTLWAGLPSVLQAFAALPILDVAE